MADDENTGDTEPTDKDAGDENSGDENIGEENADLSDEKSEAPAKKKGGKAKLIIIIVVALIVIAGGVGAGLYFSGVLGGGDKSAANEPKQTSEMALGAPVYHTYPEMFVDLRTGECRSPFLRFTLVVQLSEGDRSKLDTFNVRIVDRIQSHIRSYERQDLMGVEGADRLRTDLVAVINNVIKPAQVHAVLFNTFILN